MGSELGRSGVWQLAGDPVISSHQEEGLAVWFSSSFALGDRAYLLQPDFQGMERKVLRGAMFFRSGTGHMFFFSLG